MLGNHHLPSWPLAALLLVGCPRGETPDTAGATDCVLVDGMDEPSISAVQTDQPDPFPTLTIVSWETASPVSSWLELELEDGSTLAIPSTEGESREHRAMLRGLAQASSYRYRILAGSDKEPHCTDHATVTTGSFDSTVPRIEVEVLDADRASSDFVITSLFPEPSTMAAGVLDGAGRLVWYRDEINSMATRMGNEPSQLALHGQVSSAEAVGHVVITDYLAAPVSQLAVTGVHADFQHAGEGCWGTYSWEPRSFEDGARQIAGDNLVEACPDQEIREVWSPWDWLEIDLERDYTTGTISADLDIETWTHANSLGYDPGEQVYYYLASELERVFAIDRASGALRWTLGNDGGDFSLDTELTVLDFPHSIQPVDGGVLIFNRSHDGCSHVLELALDESTMSASLAWSYSAEECYQVYWMGQAERLSNGNTRIAWSTAGVMDEISPDGELVKRISMPTGGGFGFGESHDSLYE